MARTVRRRNIEERPTPVLRIVIWEGDSVIKILEGSREQMYTKSGTFRSHVQKLLNDSIANGNTVAMKDPSLS